MLAGTYRGIKRVDRFQNLEIVYPWCSIRANRNEFAGCAVNDVYAVRNGVCHFLLKVVKRESDYVRAIGIPPNTVCIYSGECGHIRIDHRPWAPENPFAFCADYDCLVRQARLLVVKPRVLSVNQISQHASAGKYWNHPLRRHVASNRPDTYSDGSATKPAEYSGDKSPEHKSYPLKKNGLPHRRSPFRTTRQLDELIR